MKNSFLEGFLFRPQGGPMVYPYTTAAKISQFPYRHVWHESWGFRYMVGSIFLVVLPMFIWMDRKVILTPQNKAYWREKRKHDREHHHQELVKKWEVRT